MLERGRIDSGHPCPSGLRPVSKADAQICSCKFVEPGDLPPISTNPTSNKKAPTGGAFLLDGALGRIRTPDPLVRSQILYPTELPAHQFFQDFVWVGGYTPRPGRKSQISVVRIAQSDALPTSLCSPLWFVALLLLGERLYPTVLQSISACRHFVSDSTKATSACKLLIFLVSEPNQS